MNSYREVNPAVYTIATFPFLFAVMFGDAGHGLIVLLAGLVMMALEDKLKKMAEESEIFGIFFGGEEIKKMMHLKYVHYKVVCIFTRAYTNEKMVQVDNVFIVLPSLYNLI